MSLTPYVSFIMPSRNDDHPPDGAKRRSVVIKSLVAQLERHALDSEIIIVDWNPPTDRPGLASTLELPIQTQYVTIREIVVPPEVARSVPVGSKIPFLAAHAPNVGKRRARGQWVMQTTQDHLYSEELIAFLSKRSLDPSKMYRIDRRDVPIAALDIEDSEERLAYCASNVTTIHARRNYDPTLTLHTDACGDFTLVPRDLWHSVRGLFEDPYRFPAHIDSLLLYQMAAAGASEEVLQDPLRLYHLEHASSWQGRERWYTRLRFDPRIPWAIRRLYWTLGARWAPSNARLKRLGVDPIPASEMRQRVRAMLRGEAHYVLNGPQWGFGDVALPERTLVGPRGAEEQRSLRSTSS